MSSHVKINKYIIIIQDEKCCVCVCMYIYVCTDMFKYYVQVDMFNQNDIHYTNIYFEH